MAAQVCRAHLTFNLEGDLKAKGESLHSLEEVH